MISRVRQLVRIFIEAKQYKIPTGYPAWWYIRGKVYYVGNSEKISSTHGYWALGTPIGRKVFGFTQSEFDRLDKESPYFRYQYVWKRAAEIGAIRFRYVPLQYEFDFSVPSFDKKWYIKCQELVLKLGIVPDKEESMFMFTLFHDPEGEKDYFSMDYEEFFSL